MAEAAGRGAPESKTRRRIVQLLKTHGPQDSSRLAAKLKVTPMAVRQHLYALQQEKLVTATPERQSREGGPVPVGRPAKFWRLTPEANRLFPDAYAELSVALIDAVGDAFGPAGMERLLGARLTTQRAVYAARMDSTGSLGVKLQQLARIRTEEGYMAEVKSAGRGSFLFVENHCPICAAATACQGFCATELDLFRGVLGPGARVSRAEHIVSGDRRCAYRISCA